MCYKNIYILKREKNMKVIIKNFTQHVICHVYIFLALSRSFSFLFFALNPSWDISVFKMLKLFIKSNRILNCEVNSFLILLTHSVLNYSELCESLLCMTAEKKRTLKFKLNKIISTIILTKIPWKLGSIINI